MIDNFILHPQLAKDTFFLVDWPLSSVLLMNDQQYPWFILVPRKAAITELYQLAFADQQQLLRELNWMSQVLQDCRPDKLNIAALGNVVSQLHVHIVARFKTDPVWPKPIWGALPAKPYTENEVHEIITHYQHRVLAVHVVD